MSDMSTTEHNNLKLWVYFMGLLFIVFHQDNKLLKQHFGHKKLLNACIESNQTDTILLHDLFIHIQGM